MTVPQRQEVWKLFHEIHLLLPFILFGYVILLIKLQKHLHDLGKHL